MGAVSVMNPQTMNLFGYTANDPINRTDPSGLDGVDANLTTFPSGGWFPSGGTGNSMPSWLSIRFTGDLGSLFGGGNGRAVLRPIYFWQFETSRVAMAPTVQPPLPGSGTTSTLDDPPPYTQENKDCDQKLGKTFGGLNAVGAGSGFEPLNMFGVVSHVNKVPLAGQYRGGGQTGHLSSAFHLYYSDNNGKNAGQFFGDVYIPAGGEFVGKNPFVSDQDSYLFKYAQLGNVKNVLLVVSHVKGFTAPKGVTKGKTLIGQIGGNGGISSDNSYVDTEGKYIHSHMAIRDIAYIRNKRTGKNQLSFGNRHDFGDVFCK
jgi:hypothetical protein